jgi:hypothetical protein
MNNLAMIFAVAAIFASCAVRQQQDPFGRGGSSIKAVTIKHPQFRDTMDKTLSPELAREADELVSRLMVRVSAKSTVCDENIADQEKDFGETKVSDTVLDATYTFRKGCDYVISLSYFDALSQVVVLESDGKSVNLTKAELEKPKPVARVTLRATAAGQKFWSKAAVIETNSQTDATIEPIIPNGVTATDSSGFKLSVPQCMSKTVTTVTLGIACMNEFRVFLGAFAGKYTARTWYAAYASGVADVKELMEPAADESSKAVFCLRNSVNKGALARLPSTIATANADEQDFVRELTAAVSGPYEAVQDSTLRLIGCR